MSAHAFGLCSFSRNLNTVYYKANLLLASDMALVGAHRHDYAPYWSNAALQKVPIHMDPLCCGHHALACSDPTLIITVSPGAAVQCNAKSKADC